MLILLLPKRPWKAHWVQSPVLHGLIISRREQIDKLAERKEPREERGRA